MKILNLVLKGHWYDMIECGEKTEEYREIKTYWEKRLLNYDAIKRDIKTLVFIRYFLGMDINACVSYPKGYDAVCFHRGYTRTTMLFSLDHIAMGNGNPTWGAPDHKVFILKLGQKINQNHDKKR